MYFVHPSIYRTYSVHNVNAQNTFADGTSSAECIHFSWGSGWGWECNPRSKILTKAVELEWFSARCITLHSSLTFWTFFNKKVVWILRLTDEEQEKHDWMNMRKVQYVRKSHLSRNLSLTHEGGASIVVVTESGMWHCTLQRWDSIFVDHVKQDPGRARQNS